MRPEYKWFILGAVMGMALISIYFAYETVDSLGFYRNQTYCGWAIEQAINKCESPPKKCSFDKDTMVINCEGPTNAP